MTNKEKTSMLIHKNSTRFYKHSDRTKT